MALQGAPVLARLELVDLDLPSVASDDQVPVVVLILLLEVVDTQDLVALIVGDLSELTVVD